MSALFNAHIIACKRAVTRLAQQPAVTLLSVIVIAIALAFPLGLFAVFENVLAATGKLQINPGINVYLQPALTDDEARTVGDSIKKLSNVDAIKFESREAALAKMKGNAGMQDVLAGLETNPLPHAFLVQPKIRSADANAAADLRQSRAAAGTSRTRAAHARFDRLRGQRECRPGNRVHGRKGYLLSGSRADGRGHAT